MGSYQCELIIDGYSSKIELNPLRFKTVEETESFGQAMFEPSNGIVRRWSIVPNSMRPNFEFRDGVVRQL